MRTRALLACATSTLLLVGCGDDAGDQTAGSTIPASTSTTAAAASAPAQTTTTAAGGDAARTAKAKAAVLQASDLPTDFKEQPPEDGLKQGVAFKELATCLGVNAQSVASAASPTYVRGIATQVASTVEYIPLPSVQAVAMAFGGSEKLPACSKQAITADVKRSAPQGATTGSVEVAPLDFPKLGQLTAAYRATTTAQLPGGPPIPITQDFVIVFKGEAVSQLKFLSPGMPFPADLQRTLTEKVVSRA